MSTAAITLPAVGRPRSLAERVLSVVIDLHAGEAATALLLTANEFVVLAYREHRKMVRS